MAILRNSFAALLRTTPSSEDADSGPFRLRPADGDPTEDGGQRIYGFVFAEQQGAVVGYCCYGPIPCTLSSFDLYWIVVHPAAQGQGLGRRLLQRAEQRIAALAGARVYIETSGRPQYAPTQGFYLRCGYREAARLEQFYGPEDDKLVYCKVLSGEQGRAT